MPPSNLNIELICHDIQEHYSACDISDALLKLGVRAAGFLPAIGACRDMLMCYTVSYRTGFLSIKSDSISSSTAPLLPTHVINRSRTIAPISTVLLVPNAKASHKRSPQSEDPFTNSEYHSQVSNIAQGQNWTDIVAPGTIVIAQQPKEHVSAIFGDIMVTRLLRRGIIAAVADGRVRDVESCRNICGVQDGDVSAFQVWSKGISAAGPSLEARPWSVNVPLKIGDFRVEPGDIMCLDQMDEVAVVVPRDRLYQVYELLPRLKQASNGVLKDVKEGLSLPEAIKRNPEFYSNYGH